MKAPIWRTLMAVGMKLHHFAEPRSPSHNFEITIPSRLSTGGGTFKLVFYVPPSYVKDNENHPFPVVVNFHGGGFTLGTETDDARWASAVVLQTGAVVVSVAYRLAPEYPFSVGVEDGTDAIIYLAAHAEELCLDPHRIAISGFSAGGNFAFTVPLMLHDLQNDAGKRTLRGNSKTAPPPPNSQLHASSRRLVQSSSSIDLAPSYPSTTSLKLPRPPSTRSLANSKSVVKLTELEPTALEVNNRIPDLTIVCIVSFYPVLDFRQPRDDKRMTNPLPGKNLSITLTNLFDQSYIKPSGDLADPYLSPAAASDDLLRAAYPKDIVLYTCEYDMLNAEGVEFGRRLKGERIGKTVHGGLIKGVQHAFDKRPNPISFPKSADQCYAEASAELKRVFGGRTSSEARRQLEEDLTVLRFEGEVEGDRVLEKTVMEGDSRKMDSDIEELSEGSDLLSIKYTKGNTLQSKEDSTEDNLEKSSQEKTLERRGESSESKRSKGSKTSSREPISQAKRGRSPSPCSDKVP
jgi:putative ergosteryl-3beta-O-L-aspartate hydrolase